MLFGALRSSHPQSRIALANPECAPSIWLSRAVDLVVLLVCGLVLSRNHADPDFWGHVQYGRDVLREGLPATATYSYTAVLFPWINHENLSELAFAIGLAWGGPSALLIAKVAAGMFCMWLVWMRARRAGASIMAAYAILLLISLNLMHFWSLRPQLFSFLFFFAEIFVLDRAFRDWKDDRARPPPVRSYRSMLWTLPLLMAVWTNTHGGFVLGMAVLAAYVGLRSVEGFWRWRTAAWPNCLALSAILILCVLATWLNPYGWELHRWLFEDLRVPRPEIVEWRPPQLRDILWWQWWLLVGASVGAVLFSRRNRDVVPLLIMAIVLWQSLEHLRHIPFFAILAAMWLPQHFSSALVRVGIGKDDQPIGSEWNTWQRRAFAGGMLCTALLLAVQLAQQVQRIPVHRDSYPVAAFQFIADRQLSGRMVVRFKWSQYVIAAFGSTRPNEGIKVAFDGRFRTCYPQEVADMYFDFAVSDDPSDLRPRSAKSPRRDPKRILNYGRPDLVLIGRDQRLPLNTMREERDDWTLLYQDQLAELWGRRDKYDRPASPNYLPPQRRCLSQHSPVGHVAWPALPVKQTLVSSLEL